MADDVEVRFGADASGVEAGSEAAAAAVEDFGVQVEAITAAIEAQTAELTEAFAGLAESIKESMEEAVEAEEKAEAGMFGFLGSLKEGAESVTEMREAIMGFGEAMLAVFAFEEAKEFVEKLGEAGEQVQHTAQAFGMTTGEVQKFQAEFILAGAGPDGLATALARLDHTMSEAVSGSAQAAAAYKALGINLNEPMTPAQRLQEVLEGLAALPGPEKAQIAFELFGRGMVRYAGLIGATKEQLEEWGGVTDKMNAANEQAVGKMAALGAAMNENKVAGIGLQNVLGDSLSPAFIQIVDGINDMIAGFTANYKAGGDAKVLMEALGETISVIGTIIGEIGEAFASLFSNLSGQTNVGKQALDGFRAVIIVIGDAVVVMGAILRTVFDSIGELIDQAEASWTALGRTMYDAMTGRWGEIAADVQAGVDKVVAINHDAAARVAAEWAEAGDKLAHMGEGSPKHEESPKTSKSKPENLGKPKTEKDDTVAQWQEQLRQLSDAQENWYADQFALAAQFWAGIVALHQGSMKDQQEAQDRLLEALKGMDNEAVTSAVEAAKKQAAAAGPSVEAVKAIYAALEAQLRADHADTGAQWKKVEDEKADAVRKATAEMQKQAVVAKKGALDNTVKGIQRQGDDKDSSFDIQDSQVKANAQTGVITAQQEAAQLAAIAQQRASTEIATARQVLAAQEQAFDQEVAAAQGNKALLDQIAKDRAKAEQAASDSIDKYQTQAAKQAANAQIQEIQRIQDAWKTNIDSIVNTFGSGMLNMAQHGGSFQNVMLHVGESVEQMMLQAVEKMVEGWIMNMAIAVGLIPAQVAATNEPQIASAAAVAAANAFASTAAIPIIGPEMAPGAAEAAFQSVMAFSLASAAGGYDIGNENPLTQLHAREMVLPASIAQPLRESIANGSMSGGGDDWGMGRGGGASLSDIHRELRRQTATGAGAAATSRSLHAIGKRALGKLNR